MKRTWAVLASVALGLAGLSGCAKDTPVATASPTEKPSTTNPTEAPKTTSGDEFKVAAQAKDGDYITIKGRIIFEGDESFIKQEEIMPDKDKDACLKDGKFYKQDWVIDPKTKALKNVIIWVGPDAKRGEPFPQDKIHPKLKDAPKDPVVVDQPCCQYVPHVSAVRVGQKLVGMNSAKIPHNFKWDSAKNTSINPLLQPGGKATIEIAELEPRMNLATCGCTIHPWMAAWVAIFDHPYFAITNDKGEFEIKMVPKGKFRVFVRHPKGGFLNGADGAQGQTMEIKGDIDMGDIKFKGVKD